MNQDVKRLWLEALRSGRYQQGRHRLCQRDSDGVARFCCLGVLCDVLQVPYKEVESNVEVVRRSYGVKEHTCYLPEEVTRVAGIDEAVVVPRKAVEALLVKYDLQRYNEDLVSLPMLNDKGVSFEEIADVIERAL